jgi:hypothetical protein
MAAAGGVHPPSSKVSAFDPLSARVAHTAFNLNHLSASVPKWSPVGRVGKTFHAG